MIHSRSLRHQTPLCSKQTNSVTHSALARAIQLDWHLLLNIAFDGLRYESVHLVKEDLVALLLELLSVIAHFYLFGLVEVELVTELLVGVVVVHQ